MTNAGFHRKKIEGFTRVTTIHPNQLDYAWQRFKGKFKQAELPIEIYWQQHIYNGKIVKRLTITQRQIKGKTYRKGQFIPKE